jgi:hypothetical protein
MDPILSRKETAMGEHRGKYSRHLGLMRKRGEARKPE